MQNEYYEIIKNINDLLEKKEKILIAIDGMAASGKSTLATFLQEEYTAEVLHTDDFFLQPHQRTQERLEQAGGNVDYERIVSVLQKIATGKAASYQPYNCETQTLGIAKEISPVTLTVVEGSYAMHPSCAKYYDYKIFLHCDEDVQIERIKKRNGAEMLKRFEREWIPLEQKYFDFYQIKEKSDHILDTTRF